MGKLDPERRGGGGVTEINLRGGLRFQHSSLRVGFKGGREYQQKLQRLKNGKVVFEVELDRGKEGITVSEMLQAAKKIYNDSRIGTDWRRYMEGGGLVMTQIYEVPVRSQSTCTHSHSLVFHSL